MSVPVAAKLDNKKDDTSAVTRPSSEALVVVNGEVDLEGIKNVHYYS